MSDTNLAPDPRIVAVKDLLLQSFSGAFSADLPAAIVDLVDNFNPPPERP